ncbi:MAG: hypothetical protein ABIH76_08870, partial [Candidatus Bathyarchaeota archaeon]
MRIPRIKKEWAALAVSLFTLFALIPFVTATLETSFENNNMVKNINVTETNTMTLIYVPIDKVIDNF